MKEQFQTEQEKELSAEIKAAEAGSDAWATADGDGGLGANFKDWPDGGDGSVYFKDSLVETDEKK